MGRGRQKAKHTKVARELKYFSPSVDLTALERELKASSSDEPDYEDKWADLYPEEDETSDGETDTTATELEDVIETEDADEVGDQLGDIDDDGAAER